VLGDCGQVMDGEPVRLWKVRGYEIHTRLHQARNEVDVTSEPIELGDDELCSAEPARRERCGKLRPIRPLAGLNLREFGDDAPIAAVKVVANGLLLRFQAEPGTALAFGRNSIVSDELASVRDAAMRSSLTHLHGRAPPRAPADTKGQFNPDTDRARIDIRNSTPSIGVCCRRHE
jgi:hypothetical protein